MSSSTKNFPLAIRITNIIMKSSEIQVFYTLALSKTNKGTFNFHLIGFDNVRKQLPIIQSLEIGKVYSIKTIKSNGCYFWIEVKEFTIRKKNSNEDKMQLDI